MLDSDTVRNMTFVSWRTGNLDAGRFACDRLRCLPGIAPSEAEEARRNMAFYVVPFASFARDFVEWRLDPGAPGVADAPALTTDGDDVGLLAVVRLQSGGGDCWRWIALDQLGAPRGGAGEMAGSLALPDGWRVAGPQLLAHPLAGDEAVTLSGAAFSPDAGPPRLALAPFDARARAFGAARLVGDPDPGLWTGPWPLAWREGRLAVLPSLGPTAALDVAADGRLGFAGLAEAPRVADALHGATPLARFGDGYLAMAREFVAYPGGPGFETGGLGEYDPYPNGLHVAHRLAAFDGELRMTGLSHAFVFRGLGREACGGLAVTGDRVVLT
ncbi:MAG: hypothetical protein ACKOWF_10010, partial [Chloroflexota bacterium]